MSLESCIEDFVVLWARDKWGVEHLKLSLSTNAGWPDDVFLLPLRPAWIEFKRPGKKPQKLQEYRMEHLRSLGYDVSWFDNAEKAIQWLTALRAARLSEKSSSDYDPAGMRGAFPRSGPR